METYSENDKNELIKLIRMAIGQIEEKEYTDLSSFKIYYIWIRNNNISY